MEVPEVETVDRLVCADCVDEDYLSRYISENGLLGTCYYCSNEEQAITIDQLSILVERAIDHHFVPTSSIPEGYDYYVQRETGEWNRLGEPVADVIEQMLGADRSIVDDVLEVLDARTSDLDSIACGEEQPFSEEAKYAERSVVDHSAISEEYRQFEKVLIEQARYFSPTARQFLGSIFDGLEQMIGAQGRPIIVDAGPNQPIRAFYRARVFQGHEALKRALAAPDRELGAPPPRLGRAGRLNAAGVSIFYGADTEEVALAEVRPPVGSEVAIARFDLIRPLKLLDIGALQLLLVEGSLFDPELVGRMERAAFLRSFAWKFSQPVLPDHEAFEYIVTQAVADYLANEVQPVLDGILYESPQSARGRNVALFPRASRVEARVLPEGMKTSVFQNGPGDEDDDFEPEYVVYETTPRNPPPVKAPGDAFERCFDFNFMPLDPAQADGRVDTLRVDMESIRVHQIKAVSLESNAIAVRRHQHEEWNDGRL